MKVNSGTKVANLNADTLDGVDSSEIDANKLDGVFPEEIGRQYWAVVNADGTIRRTNGVYFNFSGKVGTGTYYVAFIPEVDNCAYAATTTDGFAGQTGARLGDDGPNTVIVNTANSDGSRGDLPFSVIVTC